MIKTLRRIFAVIGFFGIFAGGPVFSETKNYLFDVQLLGIKAGEMKYSVRSKGSQYSAAGKIYPTGVLAQMINFKFDVSVSGNINNGQYSPLLYSEISDTGKRQEEKSLTYTGSKIRVKSPKLPKPHWLNPNTQLGKIDPMTAIFLALEDRTEQTLCTQNLDIFDGARNVAIVMSGPRKSGSKYVCDGFYKRIGGFSKSELKDGTEFPFTMTYAKNGEIFRAERFDVQSVRGRAAFVRR
jgi:hypothetical protein